ncbi:MAG: sulfite exporter TauE/SafE family protein, partial [Acidiferrobacterales bacterium]
FVGAKILTVADPRALYAVIGSIVIVFSLTGFLRPDFRVQAEMERWLGPVVGLASGILGGVSTIHGPPLVMFLTALRLPKDEFVGTIAGLYLCGVIPLVFALGAYGVMGGPELLWSILATVPLMLGVPIGQVLRRRFNQELFRKGLLTTLVVTGLSLIRRAVL